MDNHFAINVLTRGNMNASAITRGFVLPYPMPDVTIRRRGSASLYSEHNVNYRQPEPEKKKDKNYIVVYVRWNKYIDKFGINIYANLLKKKIEAELINVEVDSIRIQPEIEVDLTPEKIDEAKNTTMIEAKVNAKPISTNKNKGVKIEAEIVNPKT